MPAVAGMKEIRKEASKLLYEPADRRVFFRRYDLRQIITFRQSSSR
ncbi:hypothetical protein PAMC26510_06520 [Caballeronia sordidicola]|uniref:Uncharacterized protein n=1 Tax=Caballeronia sordidicola TaxID=196367 RepID=A0A242N6A5_CABSO|nr:hypothetical protein PAMC26510_06520 [Caballeronia sordidicola]